MNGIWLFDYDGAWSRHVFVAAGKSKDEAFAFGKSWPGIGDYHAILLGATDDWGGCRWSYSREWDPPDW